jgi:hypothetical protein
VVWGERGLLATGRRRPGQALAAVVSERPGHGMAALAAWAAEERRDSRRWTQRRRPTTGKEEMSRNQALENAHVSLIHSLFRLGLFRFEHYFSYQ